MFTQTSHRSRRRNVARQLRTVVLAIAATVGLCGTSTLIAGPASADSAYVYWSYWQADPGTSTWTLASEGAGSITPADGAVEGWRYGVGQTAGLTQEPATAPDFTSLCADTPAVPGQKRVGYVIDFGSALPDSNDAPPAPATGCAVAEVSATALSILQENATVRQDSSGMVCGINGYPSSGCGSQVDTAVFATDATNPAEPVSEPSTSPLVMLIWLAIGVVIIVAAVFVVRGRSART